MENIRKKIRNAIYWIVLVDLPILIDMWDDISMFLNEISFRNLFVYLWKNIFPKKVVISLSGTVVSCSTKLEEIVNLDENESITVHTMKIGLLKRLSPVGFIKIINHDGVPAVVKVTSAIFALYLYKFERNLEIHEKSKKSPYPIVLNRYSRPDPVHFEEHVLIKITEDQHTKKYRK